jgi:hypothetical protein
MIVLVSNKAKGSGLVEWEIEYANSKGYFIITVYLPGATESDSPSCLGDYSDSFVNWNDTEKIIVAISGVIVSDGSDGKARPFSEDDREIC